VGGEACPVKKGGKANCRKVAPGGDTVEGLRDILEDVLDELARSRRRRDPVTALKIACKQACASWFSTQKRKS
jgi:hypothetical protein